MSIPAESPKRQELRATLRALINQVKSLDAHALDLYQPKIPQISVQPLDLSANSSSGPAFFTPYPAALLPDPNDSFDREAEAEYYDFDIFEDGLEPLHHARATLHYFQRYISNYLFLRKYDGDFPWSSVSMGDVPFVGLFQHTYPQFGTTCALQVKEGPYPHVKATIYNNLDATDDQMLRGEIMLALRLIIAQMRRVRFLQHMIAPVLLFSFTGPQHARVIEAYFDGGSLVVRPTKLFDLRKKDEVAIKTLAQWYFGKPTGNTEALP